MNREEEIQKAIDSEFKGCCFEDEWDEIMQTGKYKKGIQWADSHPSLELVKKIVELAYSWDSISSFEKLAEQIKEELWQ
jgi:hypothetical protein